MFWQDKALQHAKDQFPKESCGLLVNYNGKQIYKKCKNLSLTATEQFILDPVDWAEIEDEYGKENIIGIVHSHPDTDPIPSAADNLAAARTNIRWWIVNPQTEVWYDFMPKDYKESLIGRQWIWNLTDCWSLVREYYQAELDIVLKDYVRPKDVDDFIYNPLFEKYFEDCGFVEVKNILDMKKHDAILMNICGEGLNHVGVYVGDNQILHHMQGRLSCKQDYTGWFRKCTGRIVRYANLYS
tara:strand:- start:8408 stop:9130 length:723 start_codon:yes stop_codon:yes gene_type:complete